jgi:peptidyl-prolyl cis-trans isomerase D
MLQFIRSKAGSVIVKILFAVLIFAFGAWGIGDIFRQRTAAETTVANVGGVKVMADELQNAVRREMDRMRPFVGGTFDLEQAKQLGVVSNVLDQIISGHLIDLEERRLKLMLDDQVVRDAILNNPAFHNSVGTFDRNLFNAILANNSLTEDRYVASLRSDLLRSHLIGAVSSGAVASSTLADVVYRMRNEKRVADTVFIANDSASGVAEPNEADLKAYYEANQAQFHSPEYRGLDILVAKPDDVAAGVEVPEDRLRQEYQDRLDKFETPERRKVEQILVADEDKAKAVETALSEGKDFAAVAKDVAGQTEQQIDFGWVERKEMPGAVADAAFALGKGETSQPVKSPLGWHIIRVEDIETGGTKAFDEVRQELATEVARDMAADQLAQEANKIEDALAGGATLAQVAEKFGLKEIKIESVDLDGRTPKGDRVELPAGDILKTAFATDQGQTSRLVETPDNGFFVVAVDAVTPSAVRPFDEVKDRVKELVVGERRNTAAETEAKAIAATIGDGKPLAEAAAAKQLTVTTTQPVLRTGGAAADIPPSLVAKMFELKPGEVGVSPGKGGWYIAQLKSIDVPDPAADKAAVDNVANQLSENIRNDLLQEYEKALRGRFPVEIRQQEIDRLL